MQPCPACLVFTMKVFCWKITFEESCQNDVPREIVFQSYSNVHLLVLSSITILKVP